MNGSSEKSGIDETKKLQQPFSKLNLMLMGACLALIVIGFMLMSGGGSSIENGFNPDIFSARRIIVGPLVAFLGFLCMAFAIILPPGGLKKNGNSRQGNKNEE